MVSKTSYIKRNSKLGRGSAVLNVMQRITTDDFKYLIEMDADFSHQPNEIANLIAIAEAESANLVIASRYIDGSSIINWPLSRIIFSRLANKLAKIIIKAPVNDYTNGFRIYTKDAVELIVNKCGNIGDGFILLSEIIMVLNNSGFKIVETNTTFVNRIRGESSLTISEIRKSLVGLYKLKK
jgi:dolichol-phosphate mannosyltransferase